MCRATFATLKKIKLLTLHICCPHVCYKTPTVSMKNVVALFALLLACGTGTLKAQNSTNPLKAVNNKQLVAINFIDNISFTHDVNNVPLLNTNPTINTGSIKPLTEVVAEPVELSIEKFSALQFKYAMMMDVEVEALTNTALYSFIDDWYGTHYRMGGTTKKGIDCSAFSGTLLSAIYSFDVPRTAREQYKVCEKINKEDLMAGDLVFFNTRGGVSHVGVYLANNCFVHSSSTDGVKISSLDESFYSRKFIGGGRVNP
jgi:cell wall-associated NlpC family hydrolase